MVALGLCRDLRDAQRKFAHGVQHMNGCETTLKIFMAILLLGSAYELHNHSKTAEALLSQPEKLLLSGQQLHGTA